MAVNRTPHDPALRTDFAQLIDGELLAGEPTLDVINPATATVFARAPRATGADLDRAVAAARRAFPAWRAATLSSGMAAISIEREVLLDDVQRRVELHYQPLGVVGIITPWNAPINLAAVPLTMALYTGNTAVLKPSPYTPLTTLKLGELLRDIVPPGVANVIAGGDDCGQWMSAHAGIDKISFTGSLASGKQVMASAASTLKRLTLELGGNDPAIVLDDVDPDAIAPKLFFAAFVNSGQVCMAVKRIYAHERVYDSLCRALAREAQRARLGDGLEAGTQLGPIQNRAQYERVLGLLDDTRRRGGRILAGAEQPERCDWKRARSGSTSIARPPPKCPSAASRNPVSAATTRCSGSRATWNRG